jgi:predicted PurR-regulated permease PerM
MDSRKIQFYFLIVLIVGIFLLAYNIFSPFIYTLVMAVIFAVLFQPMQQKILKMTKDRMRIASLLTTLIVIVCIFLPLVILGVQITKEAKTLYLMIAENSNKDTISTLLKDNMKFLQVYFPNIKNFSLDVNNYLEQGLSWVIQNMGAIFSSIVALLFDFLLFLVALYFLLKDGRQMKKMILAVSPLDDRDDEMIFSKLEMAINSVIKGRLLIVLIQGVVAATGFTIFGVPNAILWGSVTVIAALIPGIGTSLVVIPALIYLFMTKHIVATIGLAIWGFGLVGLIDNVVGPKLMGRGMPIHPFLIFLSVLGGIAFFGPIGFLLGPLTLSMLFSLMEIYFALLKRMNP